MNNTRSLNKIEILVAQLYLFCLPIRMISPLRNIMSMFHGAAYYSAFVLHALGLFSYVIHNHGAIYFRKNGTERITKYFTVMIVLLNCSSFFMAIIIQNIEGDYAGQSAFSGIIGMIIYYTQYLFIIFYNKIVFEILTIKEIKKVLSNLCLFLLLLGYWQLAIYTFGGLFKTALDTIDIFHILWYSDRMWKLSLTGTEGASAGGYFAILVLPFLLTQITEEKSKTAIIQVILWIPILVKMNSSSAYLMVIADLIGFFIYVIFKSKNLKKYVLMSLIILLLALLMVASDNEAAFRSLLPSDISYLIFDKVTDLNNGSTTSRYVPFVTNWKTFLMYPLFGVGNGLQGYYYNEFFPNWAKNVAGSDVMVFYKRAQQEIVNGGLFFPSYLSGYGLFGIVLLIGFIKEYVNRIRNWSKNSSFFSLYFHIAIMAVIVYGFQGEFAGAYYIMFIISLPFTCVKYVSVKDEQYEINV